MSLFPMTPLQGAHPPLLVQKQPQRQPHPAQPSPHFQGSKNPAMVLNQESSPGDYPPGMVYHYLGKQAFHPPKVKPAELNQAMNIRESRNITFYSDNAKSVLQPYLQAIQAAGSRANLPYGADRLTQAVQDILDEQLVGRDHIAKTYWLPVTSGAGANKTAMAIFVDDTHRAICAETSHALTMEGNGYALATHSVPMTLKAMDSQIYLPLNGDGTGFDTDNIERRIYGFTWDKDLQPKAAMVAKPSVLYITEPTEFGTLYPMKKIQTLVQFAHDHNMAAFMDGARVWNAAAALGYDTLADFIVDTGVDAVSINGTKNGMAFMDGLILIERDRGPMAKRFEDPEFMERVFRKRRQLAERPAKMAIQSAQMLVALEQTHTGQEYAIATAQASNAAAAYLERRLRNLGIPMPLASHSDWGRTYGQGTNMVFLDLPEEVSEALAKTYAFYSFPIQNIDSNHDGRLEPELEERLWILPRFMTDPTVTQAEVDQFVDTLEQIWREYQSAHGSVEYQLEAAS